MTLVTDTCSGCGKQMLIDNHHTLRMGGFEPDCDDDQKVMHWYCLVDKFKKRMLEIKRLAQDREGCEDAGALFGLLELIEGKSR